MAEESKLATAAHIASIGQFVLAVPCLILAWLAYRHPFSFAPALPVASPSIAWPSMLTPLTLLPVAVGVLSVCVVAAGVLNFLVSRRHLSIAVNDKLVAGGTPWKTKEHWRQKYEAQASETTRLQQTHAEELRKLEVSNNAELWRANEARRQCEEERRTAEKKLKTFSPLQIDALELSAELLEFMKAQGPLPQPKYTREQLQTMSSQRWKALIESGDKDFDFACEYYYGGNLDRNLPETADELHKQMNARAMLLNSWYQKISSAYHLAFKQKVGEMFHRFVIEGFREESLNIPDGIGMTNEHVLTIANKLWKLAFKVGEKGLASEKS